MNSASADVRRASLIVASLLVTLGLLLACCGLTGTAAWAGPAPSVYLEELTWPEVRDALHSGTTTIIVPAGGTEQNGPHMVLGKHNMRVKALAGRIAQRLGDTLVAPVMAYVPEGTIAPPTGHMRFPGTISIPDDAFKAVTSAAARSFKQAGFTHIVLIGDHGGYQKLLRDLAVQLNRDWNRTGFHVHYIADYYRTAETAYAEALRGRGLTDAQIGIHAGAADTSLQMAIDPALVHLDRLGAGGPTPTDGTVGDPRVSSAELGRLGVELIVARTVAAIRAARAEVH